MKRFHFPLDRVLQFRQTQARIEAQKLALLKVQLGKMEQVQKQMWSDLAEAQSSLAAEREVTGDDLMALGRYRHATRLQSAELDRRRNQQRALIKEQAEQAALRGREAKLLEKLRERRLAGWQRDFNRELQSDAEDAYISKWNTQSS